MRTTPYVTLTISAMLLLIASLLTSCSELKTDLPVANTNTVQVHDDNWNANVASPSFHGRYLKTVGWNLNDCKPCHGSSSTGGTSGKSCFTCHPSYPHGKDFFWGGVHGAFLAKQNYSMTGCQTCHGATYAGGSITNVTCMRSGCHVDAANNPKSPEACNTCHGAFNEPASNTLAVAPPRSLSGETATNSRGVGAHTKHLFGNTIGSYVKCQECHIVPTQLASAGHLGSSPAEVVFNDQLARLVTGKGSNVPNPAYDQSSLKCNNTYCHGNWAIRKSTSVSQFAFADSVMVGANFAPSWTAGSSGAQCGTCHGLPPKGHVNVPITTCGLCHSGMVSSDGRIIDKTKHINGKINVFDREYSF